MSVSSSTPYTPAAATAVDPQRWPDVATVPRCSRVRALAAELIVRRAFARLPLRVRLPGGRILGSGGPLSPLMQVHDPGAFHRRIGTSGLIGFGESYLAREWEADDLVGVLTVFAEHIATLVPAPLQRLREHWAVRPPESQRNTLEQAPGNIRAHYDLSNELFASFLDPTMTYTSAVFPCLPAVWGQLPAAQHRKIDRLLDLAAVGPGTQLLEIGTGWGELAIRAAARGARVVSVTLSEQQYHLARRRIEEAGLADRATVLLRDYRRVVGRYDAIVSAEVIESVGAEFWPVYFTALDRLLVPGGRVALQAVTMPHDRMLASLNTHTWIQKYLFPGGRIPSVEVMEELIAAHTRLRVAGREAFGGHYAETLRLWRERFTEQRTDAAVAALGFDETFRRMWTFYLAYSEAGFRSRYLDVQQLLLTKEDTTG
ncbi:class I SAM-dependent methyltransferase [Streptomyces sp. KR80]|uniref:class I SAM-dependent methyltransferase n=1 Tax=Streptomyces sp. KR80 TaxID=3457426 RepID=UPI003FD52061